MKTLSGNKKGPYGEIMPRRSKRVYSPSTPDPPARTTPATRSTKGKNLEVSKKTATRSTKGKKLEVGKKNRTKLVTPDGKSQSPLAKLRSRFGYDTGVQSEEDSETSELANTKEARKPSAKTGANDNVKTRGKASKNKKIKMFPGYKSKNGVQNLPKLLVGQKEAPWWQLDDDDDSLPDSMFPDWLNDNNTADEV
jgi:hypothetical protein